MLGIRWFLLSFASKGKLGIHWSLIQLLVGSNECFIIS
jgi:hypothetical protein